MYACVITIIIITILIYLSTIRIPEFAPRHVALIDHSCQHPVVLYLKRDVLAAVHSTMISSMFDLRCGINVLLARLMTSPIAGLLVILIFLCFPWPATIERMGSMPV